MALYNDSLRARLSYYHAVIWKSIDELYGEVEGIDEESSGAFVRITLDKKRLCYVRGIYPALVAVREARDYFSFAFRVDLHHLLSLETSEYCIKKKLGKMLCLHPSNFKALKNKIALFACGKAREAYFAGSNTLSIELRVEISDEHSYKDKEAAIDHIHAVRGGLKKYGHRR